MRGLMIQPSSLPNQRLRKGITAALAPDGRIYYLNHVTRLTSWLPPIDSWDAGDPCLPYGWEIAVDGEGKNYYINHLNKTTTYEDPRKDDDDPPPQPREIELFRHPELGFGFVAGSEKPVIVRSVKEGGPSENKLLSGDQILKIDGIDVSRAPREEVIDMVKSCQYSMKLVVCQPYSTRKSAILTAAKKAKVKSNPSRVRFAEGVAINGSPLYCPTPFETDVPSMPNVLKVFLENGQTKTFKYDSSITVQDVLNSLMEKLDLRCPQYYSLCTEHVKSIRRNKLTFLDPKDTLSKIAARPGAHNLRCLFRMTFVPKDTYELYQKDQNSFEYLYEQCCNDLVQERFTPELKYEIALRLCALHLYKHALVNKLVNNRGKVNLKAFEKEYGFESFVPYTLSEAIKRKQIRSYIINSLKLNRSLIPSDQKYLTENQSKIHFMNIISELPCYGAKLFSTNIRDLTADLVLLLSPKYGISHVTRGRQSSPITLAKIEDVISIRVTKDDDLSFTVEIQLKGSGSSIETSPLHFSLEEKDTEEFVLVLKGYHQLLTRNGADNDCKEIPVYWDVGPSWWTDPAPSYHGSHMVKVAPWSYPPPIDRTEQRRVNFSLPPPSYSPNDSLYSCLITEGLTNSSDSNLDHNMNNSKNSVSPDPPVDLEDSEISLTDTTSYIDHGYDHDIIDLTAIPPPTPDCITPPSIKSSSLSSSSSPSAILIYQTHHPPSHHHNNNHNHHNHHNHHQNPDSSTSQTPSDSYLNDERNKSPIYDHFNCIFNGCESLTYDDVIPKCESIMKRENETESSTTDSIDSSTIQTNDELLKEFDIISQNLKELSNFDTSPLLRSLSVTLPSSNSAHETDILKSLPRDIDKFIATVTIPPPTTFLTSSTLSNHNETNTTTIKSNDNDNNDDTWLEYANDDSDFLSSLIIPPPPTSSPSFNHNQDELIARFWKATDDARKVCEETTSMNQL